MTRRSAPLLAILAALIWAPSPILAVPQNAVRQPEASPITDTTRRTPSVAPSSSPSLAPLATPASSTRVGPEVTPYLAPGAGWSGSASAAPSSHAVPAATSAPATTGSSPQAAPGGTPPGAPPPAGTPGAAPRETPAVNVEGEHLVARTTAPKSGGGPPAGPGTSDRQAASDSNLVLLLAVMVSVAAIGLLGTGWLLADTSRHDAGGRSPSTRVGLARPARGEGDATGTATTLGHRGARRSTERYAASDPVLAAMGLDGTDPEPPDPPRGTARGVPSTRRPGPPR